MSRTGQPAVRHVAAVERAVAVLDALANGQAELGTNEIARRTGINASTVSRLLATLVGAGFVEHVGATGRYRLGLRLLELGNAVLGRLDLREVARPELAALAEKTGETATLSAPGEGHAVTVDFVQSRSTVLSVARLGRPSMAHATATGKVLLAFGGVDLPTGALERYTTRTVVDPKRLAAEIAVVRERGYAEALGEREEGLHALAAPVWGPQRELAGILGLQGPGPRFGRAAMRAALPLVLDHAGAVTAGLGGRAPDT
ncbi:MAG TPA: IclR family transcriptional regulator [Gaiellaceae bacterium]